MVDDFKPSKRQTAILELVDSDGFVATEALVSHFQVTPQTIRRDLNELDAQGLLSRFHGGAGQAKSGINAPYQDRLRIDVAAKRQIAGLVATLIPDGASLFLNNGTTTETVAHALLEHQNLRVVTNNINIASILSRNPGFEIFVSGGRVRNQDGGVLGMASVEFLQQFRLDFGIFGVSGIDEEGAMLEFDIEEVRTSRAILQNAKRTIVVADSHKFGRRAMNRIGSLSEVTTLVTDRAPVGVFATMIDSAGIDLRVAAS